MKVFISHSSSDKWIARQIAEQLAARGIDTFLDEKDIETGDSIDDKIQEELSDSDELLMLLSPASLKSSWVLIEIGGARALRKRLVPILLHVGPNDLPPPLATGLARDLNDIQRYYDEVEARSRKPKETQQELTTEELRAAEKTTSRATRARSYDVGERVQLPRVEPDSTYARSGTDVGWNPDMDDFLGLTAMVTEIDEEEPDVVRVDVDNGKWYWLMDWLKPVEKPG